MNSSSHTSSDDGPRCDAQGHWWSQQQLQLPQQIKQQKQRKCRGNRKQQRFRARLGRRGFDVDTIAMLLHQYNSQHSETREGDPLHSDVNIVDCVPSGHQVKSTRVAPCHLSTASLSTFRHAKLAQTRQRTGQQNVNVTQKQRACLNPSVKYRFHSLYRPNAYALPPSILPMVRRTRQPCQTSLGSVITCMYPIVSSSRC